MLKNQPVWRPFNKSFVGRTFQNDILFYLVLENSILGCMYDNEKQKSQANRAH